MSYGMTDVLHEHRQAAVDLRLALKTLLMGIEEATKVGCIDHTDCWDEVGVKWNKPIEVAEALLAKTTEYAT